MIYRNNEIPSAYNKIAEFSDNYVVWVKDSKLNSGVSYDAYIQFFSPSFSYFFTDDYRIKYGDSYTYIANYTNVGGFSYITDYTSEYSLITLDPGNDVTSEEFNRADMPIIFICQVVMCVIFLWVFKQLSRIFYRGGLC